jgi:hypothetical protein
MDVKDSEGDVAPCVDALTHRILPHSGFGKAETHELDTRIYWLNL